MIVLEIEQNYLKEIVVFEVFLNSFDLDFQFLS
jgi:hypothetical protein